MNQVKNVPELFGSMVFNNAIMKERLLKEIYRQLKQTMRESAAIDADVAAVYKTRFQRCKCNQLFI